MFVSSANSCYEEPSVEPYRTANNGVREAELHDQWTAKHKSSNGAVEWVAMLEMNPSRHAAKLLDHCVDRLNRGWSLCLFVLTVFEGVVYVLRCRSVEAKGC